MTELQRDQIEVRQWCKAVLGDVELLSDHSKEHGGHESTTQRLRVGEAIAYVKIHNNPSFWYREVQAYERWAAVFGEHAPRLLANRAEHPLAIIISELPGKVAEQVPLTPVQEKALWYDAGAALVVLHELGRGEAFGMPSKEGRQKVFTDARDYMEHKLTVQREQALAQNLLDAREKLVTRAALELIPVFEGEYPVPCHRDYGPANWLVDNERWAGVIDFEFAHWDVRVADFSRYPDWEWLHRPDLIEAFFEGYGRVLSEREEQQRLVGYVDYALSAIIWGRENAFFGFEREGRAALAYLSNLIV